MIKTLPAFLLITCRSLEIKYFLKVWLSDDSWQEVTADFSKTAEKQEKLRLDFEHSLNMNILN